MNETLRELVAMRMVEVKKLSQATEIKTITNSDVWKCKPRQIRSPIEHALEWLRIYNLGTGEEILEALTPLEYDLARCGSRPRTPMATPIAAAENNEPAHSEESAL